MKKITRALVVLALAVPATLVAVAPASAHTGGYPTGTTYRCYVGGCGLYSGYVTRDVDASPCWHEHIYSQTRLLGGGPRYVEYSHRINACA